jgi:tetratricopeptide (TPR) repeat protein
MRILPALTLFVCLAPCCCAEDLVGGWDGLHAAGVDATKKQQFATAAALLGKSWDAARTPTQQAVSANDLGIVLHQATRESEARTWLERALSLWKADPAATTHQAETSGALAMVDRLLGDYASSESVLRDALAPPQLRPDVRSTLLAYLGDLMREEGNFAEARHLLVEAESIPESSPKQRLDTAVAIADLDRDTHNWEASANEWNHTAERARDRHELGIEAACIRGLGQTWLDQGNVARAEPLLKKALAMYTAPPLSDESQTGTILTSLGQLYLTEDKTALAEEALTRALAIEQRGLGATHPQIALILELLAENAALSNRLELARTYFQHAEVILTSRFGERSSMAAGVYANWGGVEERFGKLGPAADRYRKAVDALSTAGPDLDAYRNHVMTEYARVLKSSHHKQEAAEVLAQARNFRAR